MKKILSITLILALVLGLCSCSSAKTPEKTVTSFLNALKSGDKNKADKYGDYDAVLTALELPAIQAQGSTKGELVKTAFNKVTWEIGSTTIKGSKATVTVKLTTLDMTSVLEASLNDIYTYAFKNIKTTSATDMQKKDYEIYINNIKAPNNKTSQNTITINLKKNKDSWKIVSNSATANALSGGMGGNKDMTLANVINNFSSRQKGPNTGEQDQSGQQIQK